ncbi:transmembrane protease serine 4-like [Pelodytes ibericus]
MYVRVIRSIRLTLSISYQPLGEDAGFAAQWSGMFNGRQWCSSCKVQKQVFLLCFQSCYKLHSAEEFALCRDLWDPKSPPQMALIHPSSNGHLFQFPEILSNISSDLHIICHEANHSSHPTRLIMVCMEDGSAGSSGLFLQSTGVEGTDIASPLNRSVPATDGRTSGPPTRTPQPAAPATRITSPNTRAGGPARTPRPANGAPVPTRPPVLRTGGPVRPAGPTRTPGPVRGTPRPPSSGAAPVGYRHKVSLLRRYCVPITTVILVLGSLVVIGILIKVVLDNYYFFCVKSFKFIPLDKRCDGIIDCLGSEDENLCVQRSNITTNGIVRIAEEGSILQVFVRSTQRWSWVCSDGFNANYAKAVCAEFGYTSPPSPQAHLLPKPTFSLSPPSPQAHLLHNPSFCAISRSPPSPPSPQAHLFRNLSFSSKPTFSQAHLFRNLSFSSTPTFSSSPPFPQSLFLLHAHLLFKPTFSAISLSPPRPPSLQALLLHNLSSSNPTYTTFVDPVYTSVPLSDLANPSAFPFSNVQLLGTSGIEAISAPGGFCPSRSIVSLRCIACGVSRKQDRIIGGTDTAIENWPWQASLQFMGQHVCGGSIINSRWILTAAHCFKGQAQVDRWRIQYGMAKLTFTFGSPVDKIFIPGQYINDVKQYDIALMKLKSDISFSALIQPICLPGYDNNLPPSSKLWVTGWGNTQEGGSAASTLQEVAINLISMAQCNNDYFGQILPSMLCAGREAGGADTCQGDSGGPLVYYGNSSRWEQVGIVSWGDGCGRPGKVGVYTKVQWYLEWIFGTIKVSHCLLCY